MAAPGVGHRTGQATRSAPRARICHRRPARGASGSSTPSPRSGSKIAQERGLMTGRAPRGGGDRREPRPRRRHRPVLPGVRRPGGHLRALEHARGRSLGRRPRHRRPVPVRAGRPVTSRRRRARSSTRSSNDGDGIDVLVNNAGVARDGILGLFSDDDIDTVVDLNLKGTLYVTRLVRRRMLARRRGDRQHLVDRRPVRATAASPSTAPPRRRSTASPGRCLASWVRAGSPSTALRRAICAPR